ncbi:MAG: type II toxin-antitoxin system VapC family toxin [Aquabacterium sp.]
MSHRGWAGLPQGALVVVDTAPVIYLLEDHPRFLPLFIGLFEAEAAGDLQIAISTITVAEVLAGPLRAGQDALARRYEKALGRYVVVAVDSAIAVSAARLRARYALKLPDAIQLATALEMGAAALVTHDRDFAKVQGLAVLRGEPLA